MSSYIEGESDVVFDTLKNAIYDIMLKNHIALNETVFDTLPFSQRDYSPYLPTALIR